VVMQLVDKDGINQFKFDGTGNADSVFPGSRFDSDFAAAIELIKDIRADKPDTFINLTTGTWASPFWLRYADSIWRDGEDDDLAGVGTKRERWITYRDRETYHNIVEKGPLYPLNSLMLHGIIYAKENRRLNADPGHDFANEVRSYFGTGTQLQEMYITPDLLSAQDWDVLAEAARWSRTNAGVLKDVHWVGGDPGRLDVYGWAAWTPTKVMSKAAGPSRPFVHVPMRPIVIPFDLSNVIARNGAARQRRDIARQLAGPRDPKPVAFRQHMAHRAAERAQAEGLADDERVQDDAAHQRIFPAVIEQLIELIDDHLLEIGARVMAEHHGRAVVDFHRIGHRQDRTG